MARCRVSAGCFPAFPVVSIMCSASRQPTADHKVRVVNRQLSVSQRWVADLVPVRLPDMNLLPALDALLREGR